MIYNIYLRKKNKDIYNTFISVFLHRRLFNNPHYVQSALNFSPLKNGNGIINKMDNCLEDIAERAGKEFCMKERSNLGMEINKEATAYKYDTHVHTAETSPCGRVRAAKMIRLYKEAGYDGVVITDHYYSGFFNRLIFLSWKKKVDVYLSGYKAAVREGGKLGLDVILGMEIRFDGDPNDYLVYGMDEQFLKENRELYKLGLEKFRSLASGKNLMLIQAHPFRPNMIPADPGLIDGVEIYNGNPRHDSCNHLALAYARKNNLLMTSGSDFHQPQDLARGGIVVRRRIKTPAGFVEAIREREITRLIENSL